MFCEQFEDISIAGIQAVAPSIIANYMDYSDVLGERRCKRQMQLTGIRQRHISPAGQSSADLAYAAACRLMEKINWEASEIDVLVFATQTPLFGLPSTAFLLQGKLGIKKECVVFDINLGCPASIVGIKLVASLLDNFKTGAKGLLLISDAVHFCDDANEATPNDLLFGSAGAVVALQKMEYPVSKIILCNKSDGSQYRTIMKRFKGKYEMDGEKVFSFAISDVAKDVAEFLKIHDISPRNTDYFFFHQAQEMILSTIDELCGIPPEKEMRSLEEYGNTRGASIFVTICKYANELRKKERIKAFMCAFGGGLAWGSMFAELKTDCIFPLQLDDGIYIK